MCRRIIKTMLHIVKVALLIIYFDLLSLCFGYIITVFHWLACKCKIFAFEKHKNRIYPQYLVKRMKSTSWFTFL